MSDDNDGHGDGDGEKVVNFGFGFASAEVSLSLLQAWELHEIISAELCHHEGRAVHAIMPVQKKVGGRRAKIFREQKKKMRTGTFDSMGLSVPVLRAIKRKGYRLPTPIQRRAMPLIMQGVDLVGMARTGSGKTAVSAVLQVLGKNLIHRPLVRHQAFVIPMLEKLKEHSPRAGARAIILAPTRELALQTHKAVRELAKFTNLRTAVLVGGDAMEAQFAELAQNPDIIVATPGEVRARYC